MNKIPNISVIVSTYNRPEALKLVLLALNAQEGNHKFEVVVADDGSTVETKYLIKNMRKLVNYDLKYVWHEDLGFRAASSRNKAVSISKGDYLIFLDGDCLPRNNFIKNHLKLIEKNYFVAGNRVLLSEKITRYMLAHRINIRNWPLSSWLKMRWQKNLNRFVALLDLPLAKLRKLGSNNWQKVRTCNMAVSRKDFFRVNGFDEKYQGWGYEDSDLAVRLINSNVKRKLGHYATTVIHLWHKESDRSQENKNLTRLHKRIHNKTTLAENGISQYVE
ncbi:MAG: glycosyltransferase family 2 protein [Gammaproteobacteria bacterium]|nr:glycosyltransferase family 2 protein [Gammaproteobacteria bacterium]